MTYEEVIEEYLGLVKEIEDDPEESVWITGFLNEQMADHSLPLEEMLAVLKHVKPVIAGYLELIGSRDFKKLLRTDLTLEEALRRMGIRENFFHENP